MQSSNPQILPGDGVESGIASIDPYDATLSDEFPCHDDDFDAPEDQICCVPSLDHDTTKAFNPDPAEIPLNIEIMSRILEDQQVLRFDCLGNFFPQIAISGLSVPVATLLRWVLSTCRAKFVLVPDKRLPFRMKRPFVNSLFETRVLLSQFLVTYRVYWQYHIRQSSQSHMINEVIRPGLVNPRDARYVHAFMQLLFHILRLRLLIVAWPNRDPIISALHLMFVAMSQDRLIDAVPLSTVCEPDVFDGKDCFNMGLQILGAFHNASSGTLRAIIQRLFYSGQITRFSTLFASMKKSSA
jgi:hypothetical protein